MNIFKPVCLLSIIILLTAGFKCHSEDDRYENIYELQLPFLVQPLKKEYKLGDTLLIETWIENKILVDLKSGKNIELTCTDIPLHLYFGLRLDDVNKHKDDPLFEIIVDTVNFSEFELENHGQFAKLKLRIAEENFDTGKIKILSMVLRQKGIFMINPTHSRSIIINRAEDCSITQPILDRATLNSIFDVDNTNPELIHEFPLPSNVIIRGDQIPIKTKEGRIFWFKVTD